MATEIATDTEARRRAWLRSAYAVGAHLDGCGPCAVPLLLDCDEGLRLRAASDAAWTRYSEDQR